eukprot:5869363-Amphidinium_carterae.1
MDSRANWGHITCLCNAHKVHTSAVKTWSTQPFQQVLSGITHLGLLFRNPYTHVRLQQALVTELQRRPLRIYKHQRCSNKAAAHRQQCLELFGPVPFETPRKAAL